MDEYEFEMDDSHDSSADHENVTGFKLSLVGHKIRTARKDYKCENCGAKIAVNAKYMDFATICMRTRYCLKCGEAEIGEKA